MTIAPTGAESGSSLPAESGPGERLRRLQRRRRLLREELLAVLFLLLALAATVAVLATQWLGSTSTSARVRTNLPAAIALASLSHGGIT